MTKKMEHTTSYRTGLKHVAGKVFSDLLPLSEFYANTDQGERVIDMADGPIQRKNNLDLWYLMSYSQKEKIRLMTLACETIFISLAVTSILSQNFTEAGLFLGALALAKGWVMGFARWSHGDFS